ncbi:DUF4381 domain-containing protein [Candidatus Parabeggiatoa sp. HSG14]|uniref:DUF4381 domain-containing protein n=1 Tax=Candidatus Parabeggiatoa sp. HSG14 TaxID=3055593 RepID=UPI0025A7F6B4|nr:DUF4381 domain-containing protein [Thiotrichales bacterium HSG14]
MNPTDQLRDIHGLETISWWPLAPGWWVLLGIILLIGLIVVGIMIYLPRSRSKKHQDWQRAARKEWLTLYPTQTSPREQLSFLSILLRRVAVQCHGRETCAGLSGEHWLDWLTRHDPKGFDWMQSGRILIDLPYMPPDYTVDKSQVDTLYQAVRVWIDEEPVKSEDEIN